MFCTKKYYNIANVILVSFFSKKDERAGSKLHKIAELEVMENLTLFNQTEVVMLRFYEWIIDISFTVILMLVSFYLLLALTYHQLKIEQPQTNKFNTLAIEQKYGLLSKYTCILIGCASFLRQSSSFAELWMEFYIVNYNLSLSQEALIAPACKALPTLFNFALTIGTGMVFLFLWFRQRILYIHPSLKMLNNKCLEIFSIGIIVVWLLVYIALYPIYFALVRFHYVANNGCIVEEETLDSYNNITLFWVAISILMQLSLLFLFVYPILTRRGHQSSEQRSTALMRRVKKAIVLTSITLGTDIVTIMIETIFWTEYSISFVFHFGGNLVINHLVTIACFDNWKQLLWPWTLSAQRQNSFDHTIVALF